MIDASTVLQKTARAWNARRSFAAIVQAVTLLQSVVRSDQMRVRSRIRAMYYISSSLVLSTTSPYT